MTALELDYVMARNKMGGPTVLASDPRATFEVRWAGRDDPDGEDIQPVPPEIMKTVQFSQAVRKGIIELIGEDGEAVQEALLKQRAAFQGRMSSDELAAAEALDHPQDNDIISSPCIGPSPRAGVSCGEPAMARSAERDQRPMLCDRHLSLAPRYQAVPSGTGSTIWVMGPR